MMTICLVLLPSRGQRKGGEHEFIKLVAVR